MPAGSIASSTSSIPEEEEPRLKYQRLEADTGDLLLETEAACLCVSEKMLALGTQDGTVHLLDYDGNEVSDIHQQDIVCVCKCYTPSSLLISAGSSEHRPGLVLQVRRFQAHKGPVNDLCFDETAEFIGSCSDDGGAMVSWHCCSVSWHTDLHTLTRQAYQSQDVAWAVGKRAYTEHQ